MRFWVLESPAGNYVQVHRTECERCLDGKKDMPGGAWTGFDDYKATMEFAAKSNRPVLQCNLCHPERFA
jgi:hypothetical protein